MKHLQTYKLFENFENNYVGMHCSPKSLDNDDFYGKIIDEYHMTFRQVLELVQYDYSDAKPLIKQIDSLEDGLNMYDDSVDLIYEIEEFFAENNIEWIFVSKGEAMTKYGDNCYRVYFDDMSNVYSMDDELTDGAKIYIYNSKTDKPILKNEAY